MLGTLIMNKRGKVGKVSGPMSHWTDPVTGQTTFSIPVLTSSGIGMVFVWEECRVLSELEAKSWTF